MLAGAGRGHFWQMHKVPAEPGLCYSERNGRALVLCTALCRPTEPTCCNSPHPRPPPGRRGCVEAETVAWFAEQAAALPAVNTSLAFVHIPIPAVVPLFDSQPTWGTKQENSTCPVMDTGVFDAFKCASLPHRISHSFFRVEATFFRIKSWPHAPVLPAASPSCGAEMGRAGRQAGLAGGRDSCLQARPTGKRLLNDSPLPCPGRCREAGVQAVFSGHDHRNDMYGTVDGVRIGYA